MFICIMRTTVQLDDDLLSQAKRYAAHTGRTLTSLIADGLRLVLLQSRGKKRRVPVRLSTFGGKGTLPGVDLDCSASLLDLMSEAK